MRFEKEITDFEISLKLSAIFLIASSSNSILQKFCDQHVLTTEYTDYAVVLHAAHNTHEQARLPNFNYVNFKRIK